MKKTAVLLLILALALLPALTAAETAKEVPAFFDVSYFTENDGVFAISVSEDGETAVVTTRETAQNLSFSTPYDSEGYYSVICPDISILNYPREETRQAALRIRIHYRGTKRLNLSSVTFVAGNSEYTFTDIIAPEVISAPADDTAAEDLVIVGGRGESNARFLAEVLAAGVEYSVMKYAGSEGQEAQPPAWTLILHGDEDLTVSLPEAFWSDMGMFALALSEMNAFSLIAVNPGTPCEITQVK